MRWVGQQLPDPLLQSDGSFITQHEWAVEIIELIFSNICEAYYLRTRGCVLKNLNRKYNDRIYIVAFVM